MSKLTVRATIPSDIDVLLRLQAAVYPSIAPWRRDHLVQQLEVFPQGQLRLRGKRVGHALYEGRRRLCRQFNLRRIIACGRLPGFHLHASQMPVDLYAKKVLWGDLNDPVLSFQLREGFRYCGIMKNYIPEDVESCGHAALIVWINPDFKPGTGTALQTPTATP